MQRDWFMYHLRSNYKIVWSFPLTLRNLAQGLIFTPFHSRGGGGGRAWIPPPPPRILPVEQWKLPILTEVTSVNQQGSQTQVLLNFVVIRNKLKQVPFWTLDHVCLHPSLHHQCSYTQMAVVVSGREGRAWGGRECLPSQTFSTPPPHYPQS